MLPAGLVWYVAEHCFAGGCACWGSVVWRRWAAQALPGLHHCSWTLVLMPCAHHASGSCLEHMKGRAAQGCRKVHSICLQPTRTYTRCSVLLRRRVASTQTQESETYLNKLVVENAAVGNKPEGIHTCGVVPCVAACYKVPAAFARGCVGTCGAWAQVGLGLELLHTQACARPEVSITPMMEVRVYSMTEAPGGCQLDLGGLLFEGPQSMPGIQQGRGGSRPCEVGPAWRLRRMVC
jgi:hypothetical protein